MINIKCKMVVYKNEVPYLGKGRVELLEKINEHGSITKAAQEMGLSYRKAWQLVENMNEVAQMPLVKKRLGGLKGGGAVLTEFGNDAIRKYEKLQGRITSFISQLNSEIEF